MRKSEQTTARQPSRSATTKGEARRAQILDAATECFRREGFHGSSMARIAATAGMSTGHVFHYFKRKEDIVEAIVARERTVMEGFAERLRAAGTQADMLDLIYEGVVDVLTRESGGASLTMEILAEATRNPEIHQMLRSYDDEARQMIVSTLEDTGHGAATRREILAAMVEGLSIRRLRNPGLADTLDRQVLRRVLGSVIAG
ncbi:TetR/AcrR family transcriptional regulator [Luteimonas sp. A277]